MTKTRIRDEQISSEDAAAGDVLAGDGSGNSSFEEPTGESGIPVNGWNAANGTWSYSSADDPTFVISVNADMTAIISVGMRIKLTQTTDKYFIVTAVGAFSGGATLITVYGGTDYDLANAAITNPYYSPVKAPLGFPLDPAKWTVTVTDTTQRTQANPTQNTWYNLGSISISIPIGLWAVSYACTTYSDRAAEGALDVNATLSTANNSASDSEFISSFYARSIAGVITRLLSGKYLTLSSKTVYYFNVRVTQTSITNLFEFNDTAPLVIKCLCAYL